MTISKKNIVLVVAILLFAWHQNIVAQQKNKTTITKESFKNPPNEFRIVQYQLTPQTLKKYPEYGIGGTMAFFYNTLYPKSENKQPNASPIQKNTIGELIDAAKTIDYKVWLADDFGYPSGMAGGKVVAENPDFEVKSLTMLTIKGKGKKVIDFSLPEDLYDIVHASIFSEINGKINVSEGKPLPWEKRKVKGNGLEGDWQLHVFARYVRDKDVQAQSTMSQFGHTGHYPDLMNKEAIASFISHMHTPILANITNPSKSIEGFYCNEPNLMQTHWKSDTDAPYACTPWSDYLPAQFKSMHGYELAAVLPFLFEGEQEEAHRARLHYRQAVAELLTDSFARQLKEWCNAQGIKSSGHFLLNEYIAMHNQGYGDLMKFVAEFDIPALDIPIPNPDEFLEFPYQQTRFFSSVASWKERDVTLMLLDPIIGGYGRKRLSPALPLLLNSVNMASFHGANLFTSYLPLDRRKGTVVNGYEEGAVGYSKEEFIFFNEYTGRLSQVLRGAKRDAGVALYYPIAMFQADMVASEKFWPTICNQYKERQDHWDDIEKTLLKGDIEYMIVHPDGVATAAINKGKMNIGFGSYHTLVVPQLDYIPVKVSEQLRIFEQSGGKIIWVNKVPLQGEYVQNDATVVDNLKNAKAVNIDALVTSISNSFSPQFDLQFSPGTDTLTVGRFLKDNKQVYLLVNRLQEVITVEIKGQRKSKKSGKIKVLDPSTGEISERSVPARIQLEANRSVLLMPDSKYLSGSLKGSKK